MTTDLIGTTLGNRYRFVELAGEGTFARVYKVHDLKRNVDLAAKVLRQDIAHEPTFLERFRREADLLQQLQHPHIVRYYDTVELDGFVFLLLEYVPGDTLQTYLYRIHSPLTITASLPFMRPVCTALSYAHGEGVIHRDIKPGNILISDRGQVYLTDFGIARLLDSASTLTQDSSIGTPLYMAPEQILGKPITLTADIYAMGIVMYQMVTGRRPFLGENSKAKGTTVAERVAYEHVNIPPVSPREHNPALPEAAEAVILRCLQKEPTARFPSAIAIYEALAEAVGVEPANVGAVMFEKPTPPEKTLPEWSKLQAPAPVDDSPQRPTMVGRALEQPYQRQTITHSQTPTPLPPPPIAPPLGGTYAPPRAVTKSSNCGIVTTGIVIGLLLMMLLACLVLAAYASGVLDPEEISENNPDATPEVSEDTASPTSRSSTDGLFQRETPQPPLGAAEEGIEEDAEEGTEEPSDTADSNTIIFSSESNGLDIVTMNLVNGETSRLTEAAGDEVGPEYSPDGTRIAYYADGDTGTYDLWLMNANGSNQRKLTDTPNIDERVVSWSPDGNFLAYHSDEGGDFDIFIYDIDSGDSRLLTTSQAHDLGPNWSPNGQQIAYHSGESGSNQIYVINADGSNQRQLTDGDWNAAFPAWSPDSSKIAFHAIEDNDYHIYIMNADGSNLQAPFASNNNERHAAWSADGNALVFIAGNRNSSDAALKIFLFREQTVRDLGLNGAYPAWHW